jgi:hypothetical protein
LAALFVDIEPAGDCTPEQRMFYKRSARFLAVAGLFALATCSFSLWKTGHHAAGVVLILWAAVITLLQILILREKP